MSIPDVPSEERISATKQLTIKYLQTVDVNFDNCRKL